MKLVLDLGNFKLKGAFFEDKQMVDNFTIPVSSLTPESLKERLKNKSIASALLSSVNGKVEETVKTVLKELNIPCRMLDYKQLNVHLDVEEPDQVGADRIANLYGALAHFPTSDCVIVDIGTAITVDYITKEGHYLGGAIYPGFELAAKALADYTDKLPLTSIEKPSSPMGKTTKTHIQSGIYYGMLGAVERLISELRLTANSPSSIRVIATGGAIISQPSLAEDLKEFTDTIDPHLTLVGLYEIMKEKGENNNVST